MNRNVYVWVSVMVSCVVFPTAAALANSNANPQGVPQALPAPASEVGEGDLLTLTKNLAVEGLTLSASNLVLSRAAANEVTLESDPDIALSAITLAVPNLNVYWSDEGALVLDGVNHAVVTEDGELVKLVFNSPATGQDARDACAMKIVIVNGQVNISCKGDCPAGKKCVAHMVEHVSERGDGEREQPGEQPALQKKYTLTCSCEPISEQRDAEVDLDVHWDDAGGLVVGDVQYVLLTENGELAELVFNSAAGQPRTSACGVTVTVGENGSVTITCEGSCPPSTPYCRMTIESYEASRPGGDREQPGQPVPSAKAKYKVYCGCKTS